VSGEELVIARSDSDAAILGQSITQDRHAPLAMTDTCRPLLDKKYTDMIAEILTDRYAKIESYPIGSPLDFPDRHVFVKTGTSRNFRDNWAVGFTDRYMIGVWTGNKNAENMKGVSGATGAGELFSRIVYALEPIETEQKPQLRETKKADYLEITSPLSGSVYSLDPLKSPDKQQIGPRYSTNIEHSTHSWILDGKILTGSFVTPSVGSHTLEIVLLRDGAIVSRQTNKWEVR